MATKPAPIEIEGVEVIAVPFNSYLQKHRAKLRAINPAANPRRGPKLGYKNAQDRRIAAQRLSAREARRYVQPKGRRGLFLAQQIHRLRSVALTRREKSLVNRQAKRFSREDWRETLCHIADQEVALDPVLRQIKADIVHVHDVYPLGAGVEYKLRQADHGQRVALIYDAHEFVAGQARADESLAAAYATMEREYAGYVDGFVAVSEPSAKAIQKELNLSRRPTVVINSQPEVPMEPKEGWATLRELTGLDESVPLIAYVGGMGHRRCLEEVIKAMVQLEDAHLAMVCVPSTRHRYAKVLMQLTKQLELEDRVHFFDPVPPEQVCHLVTGCTVGLNPLQPHLLNHELTLPNKVFEYASAGVPVAASRTGELGRVVTEYGLGETFDPAPDSIAQAIQTIMSNHWVYVNATRNPAFIQEFSWEKQVANLVALYQAVAPKAG